MDKETIRKAEDKCLDATKKTNWKQWVKIAVAAVVGAISAVLVMLQTSCTTARTETTTAQDGTVTVTERVWALNGSEAAVLARELVPVVKKTK